jgi:hypothetical protein
LIIFSATWFNEQKRCWLFATRDATPFRWRHGLSARLGHLAGRCPGGRLVWDKPVLIQCLTSEAALREQTPALREFLVELGTATNQGAVACVLDKIMYQINFPLGGA